jgi:hypothetical protein
MKTMHLPTLMSATFALALIGCQEGTPTLVIEAPGATQVDTFRRSSLSYDGLLLSGTSKEGGTFQRDNRGSPPPDVVRVIYDLGSLRLRCSAPTVKVDGVMATPSLRMTDADSCWYTLDWPTYR